MSQDIADKIRKTPPELLNALKVLKIGTPKTINIVILEMVQSSFTM